jgi:histidine ammonia-lyase
MQKEHIISDKPLSLEDLNSILNEDIALVLSEATVHRIERCRNYLDQKIQASSAPIYGINTGFGSLYNRHINPDQLEQLQENLVKSHACGTGPEIPREVVRMMLFLKIQSLAYGYSGVKVDTVQRLVDMYNHHLLPVIYEMGSLGASGDLAPLAHLSLPLMGEGEVYFENSRQATKEVYQKLNWKPISFRAKEGLALLNGTQFMSGYGSWCILHAHRLLKFANIIGALSLDAFDGRPEPFSENVHRIRPHIGQINVAREIMMILEGSELIYSPKKHVQDPYSFRCIPQVHGASSDAIDYATKVMLTEVNSVTDNPNVFPEQDQIISAGNFHGQPLALALDFLAIAIAELGNISERRTFQLISGVRDLPNYLVANPGINSGLMIPQYTAASLVSQNKQLCTPASVDSIVSSNGQEDHVSMGANAATKVYRVVSNTYSIFAIELITAAQAITFRRPRKTSPYLESLIHTFRETVPFIEDDRILHEDITKAETFIKKFAFDA